MTTVLFIASLVLVATVSYILGALLANNVRDEQCNECLRFSKEVREGGGGIDGKGMEN